MTREEIIDEAVRRGVELWRLSQGFNSVNKFERALGALTFIGEGSMCFHDIRRKFYEVAREIQN